MHCLNCWCQRRDSNSQTPVSKTGRYSNSRTLALLYEGSAAKTSGSALANGSRGTALALAHLVHRGGFEPPRLTKEKPGLRPGRFSQTHAPVPNLAEGRRIERPWLLTMPWFSGPVAGHSAVPSSWRRVREWSHPNTRTPRVQRTPVEPASLFSRAWGYKGRLADLLPYRPAHSPTELSKNCW